MKIDDARSCDICGEKIPPGKTFRQLTATRDALKLFLQSDPDVQPRWQEVADGSGRIRLEICMTCHSSMGDEARRQIADRDE